MEKSPAGSSEAAQGAIRSRRQLRGSRANVRPASEAELAAEALADPTGSIPVISAAQAAPAVERPGHGAHRKAGPPVGSLEDAIGQDGQPAAPAQADAAQPGATAQLDVVAQQEVAAAPAQPAPPAAAPAASQQPRVGGGSRTRTGFFAPVSAESLAGQSAQAEQSAPAAAASAAPAEQPALPAAAPVSADAGDLLSGGQRPRKRSRKFRSLIVFVVVVLALAGLGYGATVAFRSLMSAGSSSQPTDFPGPGTGEVMVTVPEGATGRDIAQALVDARVTADLARTIAVLANHPQATSIQPGTYKLKMEMRTDAAVAALLDPGSRAESGLTIPEGYTLPQVKDRLVEIGGFTLAEVEAAMLDTDALGLPKAAGGSLEGWLAPATYDVGPSDTPKDLLAEMVALQVKRLGEAGVKEADYQTILIKASILEREVNIDEYLPKVARVIENRLADTAGETRGLLQMDSSVLYGLGIVGGVPTQEQLAIDTPYNLYIHPGLPPTPIANPGERAIEMALNPEPGAWLYFVTINLDTGETRFASTLAEHEENVKLYRKYCETSDRC